MHAKLFAQVYLGLPLIGSVRLELNHVEPEMVECRAHRIETVLRLDEKFIVAVTVSPFLLLFGKSAVMSPATPFVAGSADPTVENLAAGEIYRIAETVNEVRELNIRLIP